MCTARSLAHSGCLRHAISNCTLLWYSDAPGSCRATWSLCSSTICPQTVLNKIPDSSSSVTVRFPCCYCWLLEVPCFALQQSIFISNGLDLQPTVLVKLACKLKASSAEPAQALPLNHAGASTATELVTAVSGFFFYYYYCMSLFMSECMFCGVHRGQRTTLEGQFSPSTMWVPENELRSSGLTESDLTHWAISLALRLLFCISHTVQ